MDYGLRVLNNTELNQVEREQIDVKAQAMEHQNTPVILGLAAYVRKCWQAAKQTKQPIEDRLLKCLQARNGKYAADKLQAIKQQGGSTIFMMLTDEKCTMAESWLEEILLPADENPWSIDETPLPKIPAEVQRAKAQEVQQRVMQAAQMQVQELVQAGQVVNQAQAQQVMAGALQNMQADAQDMLEKSLKKHTKEQSQKLNVAVEDVCIESDWNNALKNAIPDIVQYLAGFVKGPVLRKRKRMNWHNGQPVATDELVVEWEAPSPWDIYPAPTARTIEDGWLIEKHRLSRTDIEAMQGVDGYDDVAIDGVLEEYGQGGLTNWLDFDNEFQRANLESRPYEDNDPDQPIEALQFWGDVQGLKLLEYGMDADLLPDPLKTYPVEIWLIGHWVVKCVLNPDPLGRKPYYKASIRERKDSFCGFGLPELIKDCQDACNAAARNLLNNMAITSGPQVMVDVSRLPAGEDITAMHPWKIWQVDNKLNTASSGNPIWFFQPNSNIDQLLKTYEFYSNEADTKSGIPKYAYGSNSGATGALGTATGFSMMMNNAARGIKRVVRNIDYGIIELSIQRLCEWLMIYQPEKMQGYQGDIAVKARGSSSLVAKEQQQVRRNEALQTIMNPAALQVIGLPGLAKVLKSIFEGLDMPGIVPDEEEMQMMVQQQQQQQQAMIQQQQQAQASQGRAVSGAGQVQGGADARTF